MLKVHTVGKGIPILCLHGWGFDQSIWHCLNRFWPSDWQRISVDLPGHGQTPTMSMADFVDELLASLPDEFAVIGWSLGGVYAFDLAINASSRILHLAAVATSPCFLKQPDWPGIEPSLLTRFHRKFQFSPKRTIEQFIELQMLGKPSAVEINYDAVPPVDAELGLTLLKQKDYRQRLTEISTQISFLLGQQDSIVPAALAKALPEKLAIDNVLLIPKCGHMPFLSHTKDFITHIQEQIQSCVIL